MLVFVTFRFISVPVKFCITVIVSLLFHCYFVSLLYYRVCSSEDEFCSSCFLLFCFMHFVHFLLYFDTYLVLVSCFLFHFPQPGVSKATIRPGGPECAHQRFQSGPLHSYGHCGRGQTFETFYLISISFTAF